MRVMLIHGFVCDARFWEPQIASLRGRGHDVIAPGLPFHGGPTAGVAQSLTGLADWVAHTHLHDETVVIGHSLGGMIALQLAHDHPSRVAGLALVDSFPSLELNRGLLPGLFCDDSPPDIREWVEDTRRGILEQMGALTQDIIWPSVVAFDARPWMQEIACPLLGVYGGRGLYEATDARGLCRLLSLAQTAGEAEVVIIERAAHFVNLERPDETNAALDDWLARHFAVRET